MQSCLLCKNCENKTQHFSLPFAIPGNWFCMLFVVRWLWLWKSFQEAIHALFHVKVPNAPWNHCQILFHVFSAGWKTAWTLLFGILSVHFCQPDSQTHLLKFESHKHKWTTDECKQSFGKSLGLTRFILWLQLPANTCTALTQSWKLTWQSFHNVCQSNKFALFHFECTKLTLLEVFEASSWAFLKFAFKLLSFIFSVGHEVDCCTHWWTSVAFVQTMGSALESKESWTTKLVDCSFIALRLLSGFLMSSKTLQWTASSSWLLQGVKHGRCGIFVWQVHSNKWDNLQPILKDCWPLFHMTSQLWKVLMFEPRVWSRWVLSKALFSTSKWVWVLTVSCLLSLWVRVRARLFCRDNSKSISKKRKAGQHQRFGILFVDCPTRGTCPRIHATRIQP